MFSSISDIQPKRVSWGDNKYLATGAHSMQYQDGSVADGVAKCQSDRCSG